MKKLFFLLIFSCSVYATLGQKPDWIWKKTFQSATGLQTCKSSTIDKNGNIYLTGFFSGEVDFDPGPGIYVMSSLDYKYYGFVCKLDSSGNLLWAKFIGGLGSVQCYSIKLDISENIFISGSLWGSMDFDPDTNAVHNLASAGEWDTFVEKFDSQGNFEWVKSFQGPKSDFVNNIATDISGNVYLAGGFETSVDFDPDSIQSYILSSTGIIDFFVCKLDQQGIFSWVKTFGSTSGEYAEAITIDKLGNIYLTGSFLQTVDFDPGPGIHNLTASSGGFDVFILKLNPQGNYVWAERIGGISGDEGTSIATDSWGYVYILGNFAGSVDFDPDPNYSYILTANPGQQAGSDIFILKLNGSGNLVWAENFDGKGSDVGKALAIDSKNNIFITGYFFNRIDFNPDSFGVDSATSEGRADSFLAKLHSDGSFEWAKSIGGLREEIGNTISVGNDGNVILVSDFKSKYIYLDNDSLTNFSIFDSLGGCAPEMLISKINSSVIGINSILNNQKLIDFYPNPAQTEITVYENNNSIIQIELYDVHGKSLTNQVIINYEKFHCTVNVSKLTSGIYFLKIQTKSSNAVRKLIIEN